MGVKGKLKGVEQVVAEAYQAGSSLQELADCFSVSVKSIHDLLSKRGIPRRPLSQSIAASWTPERRQEQRERLTGHAFNVGRKYKLTHRKQCPTILGDKNPMWKGGVTPVHRLIRTSAEYKEWRKAVFLRDNWTCVLCGARCTKGAKIILHADHIKSFADFPDLRFVVSNGRTLCKDCHVQTDTYGVNVARRPTS